MAQLRIQQFRNEINGTLRLIGPKFMRYAVQAKFRTAKDELVKSFLDHDATKEILGGPTANNITNSINGGGNLFTYIGFNEGQDPITPVVNLLENSINILENPSVVQKTDSILYSYPIETPTIEQIEATTPAPFVGARSWLIGIEEGSLGGIGQYIYRLFFPNPPSRSTGGLQRKNVQTGKSFNKVPYLLNLLEKFKKRIQTTKK